MNLPITEWLILVAAILLYGGAAGVTGLQLARGDKHGSRLLVHFFAMAVVLQAVLLMFRAAAIHAIPLAGFFDSLLVLTLLFGLIFLILGMAVREAWFGFLMSLSNLILLAASIFFAGPPTQAAAPARHAWAYFHAGAMILGEGFILLAAVAAVIYLLGSRRLKRGQAEKVLGLMPNLQKLEWLNAIGLLGATILISLGFLSGILGAWIDSAREWSKFTGWLHTPAFLGIAGVWLLLLLVFLGHRLGWLRGRRMAWAAIILFLIIALTWVVGVTLGRGRHDFRLPNQTELNHEKHSAAFWQQPNFL